MYNIISHCITSTIDTISGGYFTSWQSVLPKNAAALGTNHSVFEVFHKCSGIVLMILLFLLMTKFREIDL